jgi:hypothetical protein
MRDRDQLRLEAVRALYAARRARRAALRECDEIAAWNKHRQHQRGIAVRRNGRAAEMFAYISKSLGSGIRVGLGTRLGETRRACTGFWCRHKVKILACGSATIIIATSLPPRAGIGFAVAVIVFVIGWLVTRTRAPEPVIPAERMASALHPHHGEKS